MVGSRILHYEILELLGKGGMGAVYLARDTKLDRRVALKFLPDDVRSDSRSRERFLREARAASRLSHTNVASVFYIEETPDYDFIVMEYIRGRSLRDLLSDGFVSIEKAISLATEVADALSAAHEAGIVHRDIKPENILITDDEHAKVVDFGIARIDSADTLTQPDATVGTAAYMSPEQCQGTDVDSRTDLFSIGVVLYELVAGKRPFDGPYAVAVSYAIVNTDPDPLSAGREHVPEELQRIVSKCLSKKPADRYASANELHSALLGLGTGANEFIERGIASIDSASPPLRPDVSGESVSSISGGKPPRRPILLRWGVGVLGIVVAIAAGVFFGRSSARSVSSIAVLPFENSTGNLDVEFLCNGIPESLINRLSMIPDFKVISRTSAFAFRDQAADPRAIGDALDVQVVLVGRLERRGDNLSISAELIDTRDNSQLWGDRYLRPFDDVLAIEDEIATAIADRLRLRLSESVHERMVRPPTSNPEAYQLYMKGRLLSLGAGADLGQAINYFREAIALDADFALAHAGLADAFTAQGWLTEGTRLELLPQARSALSMALALDPEHSEVLNAEGMFRMTFEWDWEGAETAYQRVIDIAPGNANAYNRLAMLMTILGRGEDALSYALKAQELDPIDILPTHWVGVAYMVLEDHAAAAAEFQKLIDLYPGWVWGHIKYGLNRALEGRREDAFEAAARAEILLDGWGSAFAQSWVARTYGSSGYPEQAEKVLNRILEHEEYEHVDPFALGEAYTAVGNIEKAIESYTRAVDEKSGSVVYLKTARLQLGEGANDPRYVALLDRMNLSE